MESLISDLFVLTLNAIYDDFIVSENLHLHGRISKLFSHILKLVVSIIFILILDYSWPPTRTRIPLEHPAETQRFNKDAFIEYIVW